MTTKKDFIFTAKTVAAMTNREDAKRLLMYFSKCIQNKIHVSTEKSF